ncbi:MAG: tetratricopeptide repeat protein [Planctomycetota bacterium]
MKRPGILLTLLCFGIWAGCSKPPETPLNLVRMHHRNAEWGDVVTQANLHLQVQPQDVEVLLLRGRAYFALDELDMAMADFAQAIELDPENPEPLYFRSMVYREQGKTDLAFSDRDRALSRDPKYQTAYDFEPSNFIDPIDLEPGKADDRDDEDAEEHEPVEPEAVAESKPAAPQDGQASTPESMVPFGEAAAQQAEDATFAADQGSAVGSLFGSNTEEEVPADDADALADAEEVTEEVVQQSPATRARPTRKRPYELTPKAISTALPPSAPPVAEAAAQPPVEQTPTGPVRAQPEATVQATPPSGGNPPSNRPVPRTTGIQNSRPTAGPPNVATGPTSPNQLHNVPLGSPGLALPTGDAAGNRTNASPPPAVAPTRSSSGTPVQLAPPSPYALHPNPLPGQTRPNLSTSRTPAPQKPAARKQKLSTSLPPKSGRNP